MSGDTDALAGPNKPAGLHTFPDGRAVHLRRLTVRQMQKLAAPLPADKADRFDALCDRVNLVVCDGQNRPLPGDPADAIAPDEVDGLIEAAVEANNIGKGKGDDLKKG